MKYSVENACEWLYPDSAGSGARSPAPLLAARGGTAAFQILLRDVPAGRITAAADPGFGWDLFLELPVRCPRNTGLRGFTVEDMADTWENAKAWCTREAPFFVYDALRVLPEEGLYVGEGTAAVYCSVTVPADAAPGIRPFGLTVTAGGESIRISGTLEVTRARVEAETLKITNWFNVMNIAKYHGAEPFGEEHWEMIRQYGQWMRRCRQNVFLLPASMIRTRRDENGKPCFDFSLIGRLIKMYLALGFTTPEADPILRRKSWGEDRFWVSTPDGDLPALSEEGYDYFSAYLSAWYAFLKENGWLDLVVQHVADEPHAGCAAEYRILSGIVRKFMPGVPLLDAVELPGLAGAVDIWVFKGNQYEENKEAFELQRRRGDELWHYSCCIPGGKYANRLLDLPLNRCRMLLWGNYVYHLPGFLHWGLNSVRGEDPFMDTSPQHGRENHYLPSGDTHCVYPVCGTRELCGSMRLEQLKGGAEEYELLTQLEKKDKPLADAIAESCFRRFDDCDNAAEMFEKARERLLRSF